MMIFERDVEEAPECYIKSVINIHFSFDEWPKKVKCGVIELMCLFLSQHMRAHLLLILA